MLIPDTIDWRIAYEYRPGDRMWIARWAGRERPIVAVPADCPGATTALIAIAHRWRWQHLFAIAAGPGAGPGPTGAAATTGTRTAAPTEDTTMRAATVRAWRPLPNTTWHRMMHRERLAHLERLNDWQLVEQAGVRARAAGKPVEDVLIAWVLNGLLAYERRLALSAALRDLAGIDPASFYALAGQDRARAGLALALLGNDGRWAFAAACAAHLAEVRGYRGQARDVEIAWARAGMLGAAPTAAGA